MVQKDIFILLEAVEHLHQLGYQRLRAVPYMVPFALSARLEIAGYTQWDGGFLRNVPDGEEVPRTRIMWSTGEYPDFIGFDLTRDNSVEDMAARIGTHSNVDLNDGSDPEYARWFSQMLAKTVNSMLGPNCSRIVTLGPTGSLAIRSFLRRRKLIRRARKRPILR